MPGLRLTILAAALLAGVCAGVAPAQTVLRGSQDDPDSDLRRDTADEPDQADETLSEDQLEALRRQEELERRMREPPPDLPRIDDPPRAYAGDPSSVGDRFRRNTAPEGLQSGPWNISPSATLRAGYDDNVTSVADDNPGKLSSPVFQLRGRVDIANEDGPDSFTAFAEVMQTWYADAPDLDHFDGSGGVNGALQLGDYVRIRGGIGFASASSADSANEGIIVGGVFDPYVDLARYIRVPASLGVSYDTGRWFIEADGTLVYSEYDDRTTQSGLVINQDYQNGTVADVRLRTGWRFTPGTALFIEGAYNIQRYKDESADSDGWRAVAGAEFELSRLLIGDIFAGYAAQKFEDGEEVTGLTYGANITWFATELISLNLEARRDFGAERIQLVTLGPTTSPVTRDLVRLRAEYEPLRQMLISAEIGYASENYEGQDRTDERFFAGAGLEYVFTPNVRFNVDYRYEQTASPVAGDSTNHVIYLGVTTGY